LNINYLKNSSPLSFIRRRRRRRRRRKPKPTFPKPKKSLLKKNKKYKKIYIEMKEKYIYI